MPWQDVENQPGIYNWVDVDRFVNTMRGKNLNVLLSVVKAPDFYKAERSEEHTSELQSLVNLVCRLLREKKNHVLIVIPLITGF